jgi:hypothetical protein
MSITCLKAIAFPPVQVGCQFAEATHLTGEGLDGLLQKVLKPLSWLFYHKAA